MAIADMVGRVELDAAKLVAPDDDARAVLHYRGGTILDGPDSRAAPEVLASRHGLRTMSRIMIICARAGVLFGAGILAVAGVIAEEPVAPAPFAPKPPEVAASDWVMREGRANRALLAGFPATAATILREMLVSGAPDSLRPRLMLSLATALMDAGEAREAELVLQEYAGPHNASYHLRVGLLAANARRWPQAKLALNACRPDDLPATDRGWWYFLQAQVADSDGDTERRRAAFAEAGRLAVSELQRTRFLIGEHQALLRSGAPTEAELARMQTTMEQASGRPAYTATRNYAAALYELGRTGEAQAVLQRQLDALPPSERDAGDQFRLMLGLIAGETSEVGRRSFRHLVDQGRPAETQRIALQLLSRGARTAADRAKLRADLTGWINGPVSHPIIEDLILARAQLRLYDADYAAAEEDARELLERFPGSPLKSAALGVRLSVAWETGRPRSATEIIGQLRELPLDSRERSELGLLLAEAWFRAATGSRDTTDYRSAADAYEAALREGPAVVPPGFLIFQQVLAEIRAEPTDQEPPLVRARRLLDEASVSPDLQPEYRWQAEWNLVKELQVRGETDTAYSRVDRLLQEGGQAVAAGLRIRFMWLKAKLAFDDGRHADALQLAAALEEELPNVEGLEDSLRADVAGNAALLRARALLALGQDEEGASVLEKLRTEHRGTQAAVYSYITQAARLTQLGRLADAQKMLTDLADNNRESEFAPLALYEAALNAERQGLDRNLQEAHNLLERIKRDYPNDELRFYAMLKQGDLLRKQNEFSVARQVYDEILTTYGRHVDAPLAQLALADTLFALGSNSVVNHESAAALYERLRDLPDAPVDLRAEAGFMWGYAVSKRARELGRERGQEQNAKAIGIYWSVIHAFLLDPTEAAKLGSTGRYWVARTLLELGQLHEETGNSDEAQRAYRMIVDHGLGPMEQAREKLERYRVAREGRNP